MRYMLRKTLALSICGGMGMAVLMPLIAFRIGMSFVNGLIATLLMTLDVTIGMLILGVILSFIAWVYDKICN